jgi:hypothetical protein
VFLARTVDAIGEAGFPASKAEVLAQARRHNVPSDVLGTLLRLPEQRYTSLSDVLTEVERLISATTHRR